MDLDLGFLQPLLTEIHARFDQDRHVRLELHAFAYQLLANTQKIMATLDDVKTAQAATQQKLADLVTRLGTQPTPAATQADLDQLVATEQQTQQQIDAIDPIPAS